MWSLNTLHFFMDSKYLNQFTRLLSPIVKSPSGSNWLSFNVRVWDKQMQPISKRSLTLQQARSLPNNQPAAAHPSDTCLIGTSTVSLSLVPTLSFYTNQCLISKCGLSSVLFVNSNGDSGWVGVYRTWHCSMGL